MPLQRRLPKRGFTNIFKKIFEVVNLSRIDGVEGIEGEATLEVLKEKGLIKKTKAVKILGNGEISRALTIHAHHFSQSAKEKIEKAGGKAILIK